MGKRKHIVEEARGLFGLYHTPRGCMLAVGVGIDE
jgi:hypothetical protein